MQWHRRRLYRKMTVWLKFCCYFLSKLQNVLIAPRMGVCHIFNHCIPFHRNTCATAIILTAEIIDMTAHAFVSSIVTLHTARTTAWPILAHSHTQFWILVLSLANEKNFRNYYKIDLALSQPWPLNHLIYGRDVWYCYRNQTAWGRSQTQKVCYRWLHSAPRMKRETRILPIGVGAFRPKLYGNRFVPFQSVDTVR